MKSIIFIAVLSALTVYNDAASIPEEVALSQEQATLFAEEGFVYREDTGMYQKGEVRLGDHLLYETEVSVDPIPNTVQSKSVEYRSDTNTWVTHILILEPGLPQGGHPTVNGFGTNHVTVTMTSALGKGFHYVIKMWGRITV